MLRNVTHRTAAQEAVYPPQGFTSTTIKTVQAHINPSPTPTPLPLPYPKLHTLNTPNIHLIRTDYPTPQLPPALIPHHLNHDTPPRLKLLHNITITLPTPRPLLIHLHHPLRRIIIVLNALRQHPPRPNPRYIPRLVPHTLERRL